ncbi:aldehyde dehydrogenase family protein [Nocardioides sp. AN3]
MTALRQAAQDQIARTQFRMTIGGRQVEAADRHTYPLVDPSTEEHLTNVPAASVADVSRAVEAADVAFQSWRQLTDRQRIDYLNAALDIVEEHGDELAMLDAINGGMAFSSIRGDAAAVCEKMRATMFRLTAMRGQVVPGLSDRLHHTVFEPYGVVARITPFNHPLYVTTQCLLPIALGNTVVAKAPDQAPLSGLRIGELVAKVLPPGVFNVISGLGAVAGDGLVRHKSVRRIAFTGSEGVGRNILRAAAETGVKHVSLELGGKNPLIIFPDADIEAASTMAVDGMNLRFNGESCCSTSRVLVHESIAEEVVARIKAGFEAIRVGDPLDESSEMGAMISRSQYEKVLRYVEIGLSDGATVVTGGGRPDGAPAKGFYVSPTVMSDVRPGSRLACEEIFGPVVSVITWRDEDEMVAIANEIDYGLVAGIWTADVSRAQRLARRLDAGYVWINTGGALYQGMPFGGFKNSGLGRENDLSELYSYMEVKSVNVALADSGRAGQ